MFKKGQLVRSYVTKRNFTVESVEGNLVMVKPAWQCFNKQPFLIRPDALRLIGNNYQPKSKCSVAVGDCLVPLSDIDGFEIVEYKGA